MKKSKLLKAGFEEIETETGAVNLELKLTKRFSLRAYFFRPDKAGGIQLYDRKKNMYSDQLLNLV